jgi:hypothetical protein
MKLEAIGFDVDTSVVTNRVRANVGKIRARAVATLARRLAVQARRDIQQEYNLKASRIRAGLSVRRPDDGSVVLRGSARAINLIEFGARWSWSKGVTARVRKNERSVYPHAFIGHGANGARLVFQRNPKKPEKQEVKTGFNRGRKKQPLISYFGTPSVGQMLKHGDRPKRLANYAADVVAREIARLTR